MKFPRKMVFGLCVVVLASMVLWTGCSTADDPFKKVEGDGPKVLVSFAPLYSFVKNVGGEHVRVISLTVTQGPHHYDPSAMDALKARFADVFMVNGLGLDDAWIAKVKKGSGNRQLHIARLGDHIEKDERIKAATSTEKGHEGHDHGEHDPHVWLGIDEAIHLVHAIRDELTELAPEHKAYYAKNAEHFVTELEKLHDEGKDKFKGKKNKRIIAMHDSLGYFARSFGLEIVANLQPQAGLEPDAQTLTSLKKHFTDKNNPVRIITVEPQYTKGVAETLKREVKDKTLDVHLVEFDTLETAESEKALTKDFYLDTMRKNIDRLAKAMK